MNKESNEKAIEFIEKELIPYGDDWFWDDAHIRDLVIELLNKLKGEDNEE